MLKNDLGLISQLIACVYNVTLTGVLSCSSIHTLPSWIWADADFHDCSDSTRLERSYFVTLEIRLFKGYGLLLCALVIFIL